MQITAQGIKLLQQLEGLSLKAYKDLAGIWTIGYGHTGKDVKEGLTITQDGAIDLLVADLGKFEQAVEKLITAKLLPRQFDACIMLTYNIGVNAFTRSTVRKRINADASLDDIKDAWIRWSYCNKVFSHGLRLRREKEFNFYIGKDCTI